MAQYRKRPVVIDAVRVADVLDAAMYGPTVPQWVYDAWRACHVVLRSGFIEVNTLEGVMRAEYGDWLIRGVQGEIYPCKPDIFAATYEQVEEPKKVVRREELMELLQSLLRMIETIKSTREDGIAFRKELVAAVETAYDPTAIAPKWVFAAQEVIGRCQNWVDESEDIQRYLDLLRERLGEKLEEMKGPAGGIQGEIYPCKPDIFAATYEPVEDE